MSQVRGDNTFSLSPSAVVGNRTHIRTQAPLSIDRNIVDSAVSKMSDARAQLSVKLAREFGLRFKETALLNLNRAIKEATTLGKFNVIEGTKGGRTADRWISVSSKQLDVLKQAKQVAGKYKNIVGKSGNFKQWQNSFSTVYRQSGARDQLGKFHDLRAAYACERYQQLTGHPAPVAQGARTAPYQLDQRARAVLALELGHNRIDVLNSYIGSASL
jgi:integrase